MYNVLDFKNALTVSFTSQRAVDINYLQQNESTIMSFIQEMSVRDAMGVKILTLLATLYVPASFVAVCFPPTGRSSANQRADLCYGFYLDFSCCGRCNVRQLARRLPVAQLQAHVIFPRELHFLHRLHCRPHGRHLRLLVDVGPARGQAGGRALQDRSVARKHS